MDEVSPAGAYKDLPTMKRQKVHVLRDNVPSVHGRGYTPPTIRTRLSNHQRNLSLDFRYVSFSFLIVLLTLYCLCVPNFIRPLCMYLHKKGYFITLKNLLPFFLNSNRYCYKNNPWIILKFYDSQVDLEI